MRRRSKTSGEPAKTRRRKTVTLKRGNAPKAVRRRASSTTSQETKVARLIRERDEALEHQRATSDILKVISRSMFNLQAVLDSLVKSAAELCDADFGFIYPRSGDLFHLAAAHGFSGDFIEYQKQNPIPLGRGSLTGRTALERKMVHILDVLEDPEYTWTKSIELAQFRTMLGIPLLREGVPIGVIALLRRTVRPFTDHQIELVTTFADQAVIAIENTRLLTELRQRTDDLVERTADLTEALEQQTATSEVLGVISSSPGDLEPVFETMLKNAVRLCDAKFGNIYRHDGDELRVVASHGTPIAFLAARQGSAIAVLGTSITARMARTKAVIHVRDLATEQAYTDRNPTTVAAVELGGVRTYLTVPMLKDDELIGGFALSRQEVRPFTDKQVALVTNFVNQAVIAIENTRLLTELRQRTDDLGRSVGELRALGEVSQAVNSTLDLETVLSTIVAKAVQISNTDAGAIYVFNDIQREFHLRATYAMDQALIDALSKQHIGLDETNVALAMAQREPTQIADLSKEAPNEINEITLRAGYYARLTAPLFRGGGEIVGLLVVRRRTPGAFPQNTIDLIKTFAAQSVLAIQNARLFDNVEARTRELARSLGDLRTAQDRLVQTEKLASLGQLTAGIAHEIKNPLNFVNNFSAVSVELIDELREALAGVHLDDKLRIEISEIADTLQGNLGKVVQHGNRQEHAAAFASGLGRAPAV
jgi:two-component system, NtrC family, sensor kinase